MAAEDSPALPLKRYEFHDIEYGDPAYMGEASDGEYVLYTDAQAAIAAQDARIERLTRERATAIDRLNPLGLEVERLRAGLERVLGSLRMYSRETAAAYDDILASEASTEPPGAEQEKP